MGNSEMNIVGACMTICPYDLFWAMGSPIVYLSADVRSVYAESILGDKWLSGA